ncbi:MAG TPA: hypothetical protein VFP54_10070 [Acidimicrobiales bacterium]|nr:hypothetical protein [Acidimicrobiales bacterium]
MGGLSAKVLEYDRIVSEIVPTAKEAGFSHAAWAPLAELVAVDEFERVGILRETMTWPQYVDFLTEWAGSKGFWTRLRRISEVSPLVYLEVEEHHLKDGAETIINSMSVFEFTDTGKIRHLDVYIQGQLYGPGKVPDYATRNGTEPA